MLDAAAVSWLALPYRPSGGESQILSPALDGRVSIEWKEIARKLSTASLSSAQNFERYQ